MAEARRVSLFKKPEETSFRSMRRCCPAGKCSSSASLLCPEVWMSRPLEQEDSSLSAQVVHSPCSPTLLTTALPPFTLGGLRSGPPSHSLWVLPVMNSTAVDRSMCSVLAVTVAAVWNVFDVYVVYGTSFPSNTFGEGS